MSKYGYEDEASVEEDCWEATELHEIFDVNEVLTMFWRQKPITLLFLFNVHCSDFIQLIWYIVQEKVLSIFPTGYVAQTRVSCGERV